MSVQPVYNPPMSPVLQTASTSSDPQVRKIMSQIKDWEGCPTTDPQTKKKKVDALEQQLASVESSLKSAAQAQQQVNPQSKSASAPGFGNLVDVRV